MRGQPAQVLLDGRASDAVAAVVLEYVEGQDLGGDPRVEHANQCAARLHLFGTYLARPSWELWKWILSCANTCGPDWDRTSDLPRVRRTLSR